LVIVAIAHQKLLSAQAKRSWITILVDGNPPTLLARQVRNFFPFG
jgi:hypothetical protein